MNDIEGTDTERAMSEEYLRGIMDATEYAIATLEGTCKGNVPKEIVPALGALYDLGESVKRHRAEWFIQVMGAYTVGTLEHVQVGPRDE